MSAVRLLELWAPPPGYRLASMLATTYQMHADFIEEDLLPVALGLRHAPARGRDFRLELERALQDVEVTVYLHPDGYQPGMRRTPRIDLIPVPESSARKLHAKVALLRFVDPQGRSPASDIVRVITGSANLTTSGYRNNIEVAVAVDDAPGCTAAEATVVRDAATWFSDVLAPATTQAQSQHRCMQAVFAARPIEADRSRMTFVGLPRSGGLLSALGKRDLGKIRALTVASPFWPTGSDLEDVVSRLVGAFDLPPKEVRLIGPARSVEGRVYPEMPPSLLRAFMERQVDVSIAYADPRYGCGSQVEQPPGDEDGEYDQTRAAPKTFPAWRELHAKLLLVEGSKGALLAMGSFNFTRRGLGLFDGASNTEAGLVWHLPAAAAGKLASILEFAGPWQRVTGAPEDLVKAPEPQDGKSGQQWPSFIYALTATREGLIVEGDADSWPERLTVSMRDIRSRLVQQDRHFDPWHLDRPAQGGRFKRKLPLVASWISDAEHGRVSRYPPLADLEVTLEWADQRTVLPVVFLDKHEFPLVESIEREDERRLLDWFLGLRPEVETEPTGFGHSIDPDPIAPRPDPRDSGGILSYLVRDFVHALPGIRAHLEQGATTETGLRTALLGPRSPARLAEEALNALIQPAPGHIRKTVVATTFQLVELRKLVATAALPSLPDDMSEALRCLCLKRIDAAIDTAVSRLERPIPPTLQRYLHEVQEVAHAKA